MHKKDDKLTLEKVSETKDYFMFKLSSGGNIIFKYDKKLYTVYDNLGRGYTLQDSHKDNELAYIFREIERTMTMKLIKRKSLSSLLTEDGDED